MRGADFVFMLVAHAAFLRLGISLVICGQQALFGLRATAFGHVLCTACIQHFNGWCTGCFQFIFPIRNQPDMVQVMLAMPYIQGNGFLHLDGPLGRRVVVATLEILLGQ